MSRMNHLKLNDNALNIAKTVMGVGTGMSADRRLLMGGHAHQVPVSAEAIAADGLRQHYKKTLTFSPEYVAAIVEHTHRMQRGRFVHRHKNKARRQHAFRNYLTE